ncbi:hypothetical protein BCR34DRAFT_307400 [Clohesyomyces aquaticus]|uniref:Uncharacterized protein n=1 Tax=Clohesyomyces aquaticus TaxID=1231657 RepID=A0A1Y1ZP90_9PLEO|nr:hypothetical protein BCR34DRAFT_307400 [Clohesyomyces aquaticus]
MKREYIHSFRLRGDIYNRPPPDDAFSTEYELISSLSQLKTFSFDLEESDYNYANRASGRVIQNKLQSLPPSVVNLELDTDGKDCLYREPSTFLCHNINRLLPQLEILRLCTANLCLDLFDIDEASLQNCPLRVVVIILTFKGAHNPRDSNFRNTIMSVVLRQSCQCAPTCALHKESTRRRVCVSTSPIHDPQGIWQRFVVFNTHVRFFPDRAHYFVRPMHLQLLPSPSLVL